MATGSATRTALVILLTAGLVVSPLEGARAAPAVTTTDLNFRSGPGTRHAAFAVLPAGTEVDIVACADATVWCEVFADGRYGFVSGNFLREVVLPFDPPAGETLALPGWELEVWEEIGFDAETLDGLVAPFALFPDAVVAEILIAATSPLDIVLAARWILENEALTGEARETAVADQRWDESVAVLALAFPDIVTAMAEDLAFTRDLGDAVLVQSEDVLEAIQRQRRRARAVGNLESNAVQTVEVNDTHITIAPAQPDVIVVPRYDPAVVFTEPAPVIVQQSGVDAGALALTGAIAFGTGLALSQTFRRNDWWGPSRVNWTNNVINVRPGWRPPPGPGWRPPPGSDWRPGPGRPGAGRPPGRPGEGVPWRPDERVREEARDRIRDRRPGTGRPPGNALRPGRPDGMRPGRPDGMRPDRPGLSRPDGTRPQRPDLARPRPGGIGTDRPAGARPRPDRAALEERLQARPGGRGTALERPRGGRADAQRAAERARQSAAGSARRPDARRPQAQRPQAQRPQAQRPQAQRPQAQRPQAQRPQQRAAQRPRQAAPQRPSASRASQQRSAQRASAPRRTAVDRGRQGGRNAAANRARGASSRNARNRR